MTKEMITKIVIQEFGKQVMIKTIDCIGQFFIEKTVLNQLEQFIGKHLKNQLRNNLKEITQIINSIKVDNKQQINDCQNEIIKIGIRILERNMRNEINYLYSILSGTLKQKFSCLKYFQIALQGIQLGEKLLNSVKSFTNKLNSQLKQSQFQHFFKQRQDFSHQQLKKLSQTKDRLDPSKFQQYQSNVLQQTQKKIIKTLNPSHLQTIVDKFAQYFKQKIMGDIQSLLYSGMGLVSNYTTNCLMNAFQTFSAKRKNIEDTYQSVYSIQDLTQNKLIEQKSQQNETENILLKKLKLQNQLPSHLFNQQHFINQKDIKYEFDIKLPNLYRIQQKLINSSNQLNLPSSYSPQLTTTSSNHSIGQRCKELLRSTQQNGLYQSLIKSWRESSDSFEVFCQEHHFTYTYPLQSSMQQITSQLTPGQANSSQNNSSSKGNSAQEKLLSQLNAMKKRSHQNDKPQQQIREEASNKEMKQKRQSKEFKTGTQKLKSEELKSKKNNPSKKTQHSKQKIPVKQCLLIQEKGQFTIIKHNSQSSKYFSIPSQVVRKALINNEEVIQYEGEKWKISEYVRIIDTPIGESVKVLRKN